MEQTYVSLDLETTGLNPDTDEIIEIGARRAPCSMSSGHTHDMRKKTRQIQQLCTPHCAPAPELLAHPLDQFRDTLCCLLFWPGEEIEQRLPFRGQFVAHVF
jgi:hypothetical protein